MCAVPIIAGEHTFPADSAVAKVDAANELTMLVGELYKTGKALADVAVWGGGGCDADAIGARIGSAGVDFASHPITFTGGRAVTPDAAVRRIVVVTLCIFCTSVTIILATASSVAVFFFMGFAVAGTIGTQVSEQVAR